MQPGCCEEKQYMCINIYVSYIELFVKRSLLSVARFQERWNTGQAVKNVTNIVRERSQIRHKLYPCVATVKLPFFFLNLDMNLEN